MNIPYRDSWENDQPYRGPHYHKGILIFPGKLGTWVPILSKVWSPRSPFSWEYGTQGSHLWDPHFHMTYITNTVLSTVAILLLLDTDLLQQACFSYYTQLPDTTSLHSLQINKSIQAYFQSCYHHIQVSVRPHLN